MLTNAMTVDVEDYFHVQAFAGSVDRRDWNSFPLRVSHNTRRVLDIFAEFNVTATFFVLGWVAERCPELIRDIQGNGHEIGCHSYAHQAIYSGDAKMFREDLERAKAVIEDCIGVPVRSYRAPSFSVTAATLWALDILAEIGFRLDSSIYPVVHDNYGIPTAPRFPHRRALPSGAFLTEFPPSTIRLGGANFAVAGGGYLRLLPYSATAWAIRRINCSDGQPAMVYLHPWEFDPDQPRIAAPRLSRFRHYQNLNTTESKCRRLLAEFAWAPMTQVLEETMPAAMEPVGNEVLQ